MSNDIAIRAEGLGKRYQLGQTLDLTRNFRETLMTLPRHFADMALRAMRPRPKNAPSRESPSTTHDPRPTNASALVQFDKLTAGSTSHDPRNERVETTDHRPQTRNPKPETRNPKPETPNGEFWALRDVSFEVKRGEVVGIIGRNGAGKSTLLKILSRITAPTAGHAEIHGRVGSLLEVGTGFNPELTGRENIYLNGSILGMKKAEIDRKFDEIVAFAEVERFLDTPVKRYSSGMGVRLGFAVAAHLDPEILIVDEVLAVGDAAFRQKCMGKMSDSSRSGRTVLFVSHNMAAIASICPRCLLLDMGIVVAQGKAHNVIAAYLDQADKGRSTRVRERKDRTGTGRLRFLDVWCNGPDGSRSLQAQTGGEATIMISFQTDLSIRDFADVAVSFSVATQEGRPIALFRNDYSGNRFQPSGSPSVAVCVIPHLPLMPGVYDVSLYSERRGEILDWVRSAARLEVVAGDYYGSGLLPPETYRETVLVEHQWTVQ